jgi:hypothetical protein
MGMYADAQAPFDGWEAVWKGVFSPSRSPAKAELRSQRWGVRDPRLAMVKTVRLQALAWRRVAWSCSRRSMASSGATRDPRVCVVGAGPSGFYAAKYLLKELGSGAKLDMLER